MLWWYLVLISFGLITEGAVWNVTCPTVASRILDLKELDGTWYLSAAASHLQLDGDCAMVIFKHTSSNTTDLSISWVNNRTASFYNGTAGVHEYANEDNSTGALLRVAFEDQKLETYYFLDINYDHYAVAFACNDNVDGNSSTYELWQLSRRPHLKAEDTAKINEAIAKYNLQDTEFLTFNNTEECCKSSGDVADPTSLLLSSAIAVTLFRRGF